MRRPKHNTLKIMNKDNIKTMTKADVGELKSGDIVYIRMRVSSFYGKEFDSDIGFLLDFPGCCGGTEHRMSKRWLHRSIMREIGIKNTEISPKYDPNRLFRKGDKVEHHPRNGRRGSSDIPDGKTLTVTADEELYQWIYLTDGDNDYSCDPAYLELITPVEELEPYIVVDAHTHWDVADKNMKTVAMYSKGNHPHAKEAAEAECARMNAEHRKEKK